MKNTMTSAQYDFAIERIKLLQRPEFQPLGLALSYELDQLMSQTEQYESEHDAECLARMEAEAEVDYMDAFESRFLDSMMR